MRLTLSHHHQQTTLMKTQHTADYVAHGCAIYTADDWRDGTNHGGKIVASTALFAETIANALNSAPALLSENERLRGALTAFESAASDSIRIYGILTSTAATCDALVLARAALKGGGL